MTQDDFNRAVLHCTGGPEWDIVKKGLANDIYQTQARALDASSWDEVNEMKGFAKGLAFILNLRESTLSAMNQDSTVLSAGGPDDAFL
ncbi:MAG: hypothetical protein ACYSUV_16710 [Planctomycetota bacterium]|jgi:hypothetical protein